MIFRVYVYRVPVPDDGRSRHAVTMDIKAAADRVAQFNPMVTGVEVERVGSELEVSVHLCGRDQWWVKKQAMFAVTPFMTLAKLSRSEARLVAVERLEDRRSTRERASDGRSNPLAHDVMVDHEELAER